MHQSEIANAISALPPTPHSGGDFPRLLEANLTGPYSCSCCDSVCEHVQGLVFKRMKLCLTVLFCYIDIGVDSCNAYSLLHDEKYYWGACFVVLLFVPNFLTWQFLWANGMAKLIDLPIVLLQLGPLIGLLKSWSTGDASPELLWYSAAEGLIESASTGMLTAYILANMLAFKEKVRVTFYLGLVMSFAAVAKTATMVNFHGKKQSIGDQASELISRYLDVSLRISSLALFGFLMRPGDSENRSMETVLPAWLVFSVVSNAVLIKAAEPRCPISVVCFFAVAFVFTAPMRFLSIFERLHWPFTIFRAMETVLLITIGIAPLQMNHATSPLQLNPKLWNTGEAHERLGYLLRNDEMGSYFLPCILCIGILWKLMNLVGAIACWVSSSSFCRGAYQRAALDERMLMDERELRVLEGTVERAQRVQRQFLDIVRETSDILTVNLYVNLEGTNLSDIEVVIEMHNHFPEESVQDLLNKGMPRLSDYKHRLAEVRNLDKGHGCLRAFKSEGVECSDLHRAGYSCAEAKEAGFGPTEAREAGYVPGELREVGYDIAEIKAFRKYDRIRCKNNSDKDWRQGTVIEVDPLVVRVDGLDNSRTWDLVELIEAGEIYGISGTMPVEGEAVTLPEGCSSTVACSGKFKYIKWEVDFGTEDFEVCSIFEPEKVDGTAISFVLWSGEALFNLGLDGKNGHAFFYDGGSSADPTTMVPKQLNTIVVTRTNNLIDVILNRQLTFLASIPFSEPVTAIGWRPMRNTIKVESLFYSTRNVEKT